MNKNATHKLPTHLNTPLFKRVASGIKVLNTQSWPITIWNYLQQISTNSSIISDINIIKSSQLYTKFNILAELLLYLKNHDYTNIRVLTTLTNIIRKQASNIKISKSERYNIRKYFETDDIGIQHFKNFCQYIKDKNILTAESVLLLNPFTSILNLNEIYTQITSRYTISYKYAGRTHTNIILYTDDTPVEISYVHDVVSRVCLYPYLLKSSLMPNTISIYMVEFPKEFIMVGNKDPVVFTSSEINTGVTDGHDIAITRKEEALKTILHELIHFYDMDFKDYNIEIDNNLMKHLNINNKLDSLNIFEAYTECIASIINILFWMKKQPEYSTISTKAELTLRLSETMFIQVKYTLFKVAKILKLSKCTGLLNQHDDCKITQTTNVISYFIIKLLLYLSLDNLAKTCLMPSTGKFIVSPNSFANLDKLINTGIKHKLLTEIINYLLKSKSREMNQSSARMSYH